jgi:hypothetical protein
MRTIDQGSNNIKPVSHYLLTAKCTLKTADELHRIEPMVMLRKVIGTPLQFDVGAQYTYNNMLWGNIAFRSDYATSVAAGINVKSFRIGYARDFAFGELSGIGGSSNEIMLGYKFKHIPVYGYDGKKGISNTGRKRRIMGPSSPGPITMPQKYPSRGKVKGYAGKRRRR